FIAAYASTIDTAAWVILLLMFELETYALDDRHFTRNVTWTLQGTRLLCYIVIVYAFYGYVAKLVFLSGIAPLADVNELCTLASAGWSYAIDLDEYTLMSAANCSEFSTAAQFFRFPEMLAVVDGAGRVDILRLAWTDVINAGVWLLVVLVLEIDVRLQEHNRYEGLALRLSNAIKVVLYSILLLAAVYWGVNGDFVDFWDAFLWLVAFVFIELNVFEWRQETLREAQTGQS
ncbi:MAG: hypothetical protein KJO82_00330, partial [Gammaproteobacteria bacterium]|nr:hypothetical protein [Gammaproteobacteria bacterium]